MNSLSDDLFETLRWKIRNIRKSREISRKQNTLEVWEGIDLYVVTSADSGSQMSIDIVEPRPEQNSFIEENSIEMRKPVFQLTLKAARSRLKVLLKHIQFIAQREQVDEKKVVALALELISNQEYDRETSNVCKEIITTGTYGNLNKVSIPKSSYIVDLLEIGAYKSHN